jgi:hypothetical protein
VREIDRDRLPFEWNATAIGDRKDASTHQLFEEQARGALGPHRGPEAIAVLATLTIRLSESRSCRPTPRLRPW